ncbi:WS/DGAT domain-containing protein [Acetobacterium woodii]|uniref:Siderophore/surfactin synthetase-like protein n=1 Tax=Acetobacterium woodii (strain ATCC 29683 / DSM 1030 / JCM 2381 / KCTC 1655 / WB1) TaxID=931626 RepID=H6LK68_ACEWD|nr:WS/DGAT domain-containing protein [Acetobacterium woodii]AFA49988.1 siderophore/surfactin synthetase-like protein [Acetobacterium woodii DSM 1030]
MKVKAETFDKLQYLYEITGFNDHQLHGVIQFENKVNAIVMQKAVTLLVKTIPMLSKAYKNEAGNSYWEEMNRENWDNIFTTVFEKDDFDRFTFSKTDAAAGPQIKVCLMQADRDAMSIVMNHMVCDGAGFKQCMYLLADIYSHLIKEPDYLPDYVIDGERGFKKITQSVNFFSRIMVLLFESKDNNQKSDYEFPLIKSDEAKPFITTHEIEASLYQALRNSSKNDKVTINDVILTAYFRALSGVLKIDGEPFNIPIMIDMRRYLADKRFQAVTNLSSTVAIRIAVTKGETFSQTLNKINAEMAAKKAGNLGLNTFLKLDLLSKFFPEKSYQLLKNSLKNPPICMTNLGVVDSKQLYFEGSPVSNAIVCGSIKYRPHFQMSASTFADKMTFCVNLYGSQSDRQMISKFLDLVEKELTGYIATQTT